MQPLDSPLFAGCSRRERQLIDQLGTVITAAADRTLVEEGRIGREFLVVLSGEVIVRRHDTELARLVPGEWLGELALLDPSHRRNASAVTTERSSVLVLGQAEFERLCRDVPRVGQRLRATALERTTTTLPPS
jgi:CRP-like cAMP-binding protein